MHVDLLLVHGGPPQWCTVERGAISQHGATVRGACGRTAPVSQPKYTVESSSESCSASAERGITRVSLKGTVQDCRGKDYRGTGSLKWMLQHVSAHTRARMHARTHARTRLSAGGRDFGGGQACSPLGPTVYYARPACGADHRSARQANRLKKSQQARYPRLRSLSSRGLRIV